MALFVQLLLCLLLLFGLSRQVLSCEEREKPLLLSPYLDQNEIEKARSLSKVDRDCLEDFVPDSYTGFLTVDEELGNHMFFWFFPSTDNKENSPLLLWLNGGPTVSSMLGLFWEHGPMAVIRNQTTTKDCKENPEMNESGYTKRKYSWTGPYSMLYVDNPVGVGFSFSDSGAKGHRFSEDGYTKDMMSFLKQFFKLFPDYKARDIYFGGQSYAGKYVSAIAYAVHKEIVQEIWDINLTGIYLGGPWYDPESQNGVYYDFYYMMGGISFKTLQDMKEENKIFFNRARNGQITDDDLDKYLEDFYRYHDSIDNHVTQEVAGYAEISSLLSKPKMKSAAHVGSQTFVGTDDNDVLFKKFLPDLFLHSNRDKMSELMNHYKVLIYNGDYDDSVSTLSVEAALASTPWKFQEEYNASVRSLWRQKGEVVGFYSRTDTFCRVVVHGAGHQTPRDQPEVVFSMMQQFIANGCVESDGTATN